MTPDSKIVDNAVHKPGEHFDTVRIFVTKHSGESTDTWGYSTGLGNFFAQVGQINEWKSFQDQISRDSIKSES